MRVYKVTGMTGDECERRIARAIMDQLGEDTVVSGFPNGRGPGGRIRRSADRGLCHRWCGLLGRRGRGGLSGGWSGVEPRGWIGQHGSRWWVRIERSSRQTASYLPSQAGARVVKTASSPSQRRWPFSSPDLRYGLLR